MKNTALLLVALTTFTACASPRRAYLVDLGDTELAVRSTGSGKETFVVTKQGMGEVELRRVVETVRDRVVLGLRAVELDKRQAQSRGVRPYAGLLVKPVESGGPAALAGVLPGDVLVASGEQELVYEAQLDALLDQAAVGEELRLTLLRGAERTEKSIKLAAGPAQPVRVVHKIPMTEPAFTVGPFAGLRLRGVPEPYDRELFGEGHGVVVAYVEVGSPAWVAGLRAGDVVEAVDGAPVPAVDDLTRRIAAVGEQQGSMRWQVTRGRGERFETEFRLHDYRDGTDVHVPLVFHIDDDVAHDRWAIGPFGLVMSSRTSYVAPTPTREAETRNEFSALLGLFCVDSGPRDTSVRLLWFIRFDT